MTIDRSAFAALGVALLAATFGASAAEPVPLARAHAHNDYEHARPLLDALEQGFCSVEADIYLVEGQLLVAHDRKDVKPERTLQRLYLDPLRERVKANGGHVYRDGPEFMLLIDIKADANGTWQVLQPMLEQYRDLLTSFTDTNRTTRAITVVLSGDRPIEQVKATRERLCGIDGRLLDLDSNPSPNLYPLVSDNWRPTFNWFQDGKLPEQDRAALRRIVTKAHAHGCRLRFWGVQDQPFAWRELYDAGVDYLNTDKLSALAGFLREASSAAPAK